MELLRRGYRVFVGKIDSFEVDFVAQDHKGIIYYQVALTTHDESTLHSESQSLLRAIESARQMSMNIDMKIENGGQLSQELLKENLQTL